MSSSDHFHHPKRLKDSSAEAGSRPSSKSMNTNLDDLPDEIMFEILCRLPSHNFVSQCKCVSKRWCTLISDPSFVGHFLWIQSDRGTPIIQSPMDCYGDEHFTPKVFERLRSLLSLKQCSLIVATYNDLVLCSEKKDDRLDFFLCNPRTMQVVNLPPTPGCHKRKPLGLICEPFYEKHIAQRKDLELVIMNDEYRCKVVRLFTSENDYNRVSEDCIKINIQVFSSDTGEWTESVASWPHGLPESLKFTGFASNGIQYWLTDTCLIALDVFMINNSSSTNDLILV